MRDLFPELMQLPAHVVARRAEPKPLLDLPAADMRYVAAAISPARVCYGMNAAAKRIADVVSKKEIDTLSAKARNAAIRICWRYRRQMPDDLVRLLQSRFSAAQLKTMR